MKFCWRRFRHFVAAYFVLGLSATLAHGALTFSSLDVLASADPEPESVSVEVSAPVSEVEAVPTAESTSEEVSPTTDEPALAEEASPAEVITAEETPAADSDGSAPASETSPEGTPEAVPSETASESEVITTESESVISENVPDSWPAEPLESEPGASSEESSEAISAETTPGAEVPVSESEVAPAESEPVIAEETPETDQIATPVESESPATEDSLTHDEAPETAPDSWPVVPLEPEPVLQPEPNIVEELPPYLEARGTLESVINKLDWLYTLRAEADYDLLGSVKLQTSVDMIELADILDAQGANSQINTQFCTLSNNFSVLRGVLAPGADDTQPDVDADNLEVLTEIEGAIALVETMWTTESGLMPQCGN